MFFSWLEKKPNQTAADGSFKIGLELALFSGVGTALALLFYFPALTLPNGIPGESQDTQFILFVYEHLHQALQGLRNFQDLQIFYPWSKSLGFSEVFLLFQVFYSPLRWLGLNTTLAYTLTLAASNIMGFVSLACFVRYFFRIERWLVCLIAAGFHFGGFLFSNVGHSQVFALEFVILAFWLFSYGLTKRQSPQGYWWLTLSGIVYSLSFLTSFYMTWLFSVVAGFCLLSSLGLKKVLLFLRSRQGLQFNAAALPGLVLTLYVYIPAYSAGGRRKMGEVITNALNITDLLRSPGYLSLNSLLSTDNNCEHYFGLPFILLTAVCISVFLLHRNQAPQRKALLKILLLSLGIVLLTLKFSFFGEKPWTGWGLIYNLIPGGHAIRAPGRVIIILVLLWLGLFATCFSLLQKKYRAFFILMSLLIFAEQLAPLHVSTFTEPTPSLPPASCKSFYVTPASESKDGRLPTQLNAMWISLVTKTPTLNGYSGAYPPQYTLVDEEIPFPQAVESWIESQKLNPSEICEYVIESDQWIHRHLPRGTN